MVKLIIYLRMDFLFSTNIEILGKYIHFSVSCFGADDYLLKLQGDPVGTLLPDSLWIWHEDNQWNCSETVAPEVVAQILAGLECRLSRVSDRSREN